MGNLKKQNKQMKFAIAALLGSASATSTSSMLREPGSTTSTRTPSPTEPKRSTSSESQSSRPPMLRSRPTTASTCPISSPPTSCPPGPRKRERDSTATRPPTESRPQSCSTSPTWAMERTGLTTVPSPRSRTKDSADHAGHSPPLAPWRVPISSPQETSSPSPSNSSLTATASTTTAATVVSWTTPSYTKTNPLQTEDSYPYVAKRKTCHYEKSEGVVSASDYHDVANSEAQLKAAINKQPVSVAIEADQSSFQLYHGGVITHGCGTRLDHGVLAVGWGTLDDEEYILVKNSWGPSWGDHGYVRIAPNQCGITHAASYPTTD